LAVLKALDDGTIDYAYLWANVGWTLHATPEFKHEIVPGYVPEDNWNIAVAVRKGDAELKRRLDTAIEKLVKDGTVAKALARYHMPHWAPFADEKKKERRRAALGNLMSSATRSLTVARNRGWRRCKPPATPTAGLERVRSAGALVVGLGQKQPPLLDGSPQTGRALDYEIAGLLAAKLGVSLRVFLGPSLP